MLSIRSALVLVVALAIPAASIAVAPQKLRVVDGDTIVLEDTRIRLFGIDAPEMGQRCDTSGRKVDCGVWASSVLQGLVQAGPVTCEQKDWDSKYNRPVSLCRAGGQDLSAAMVRAGAAVAYVKYSDRYLPEERAARAELRGIWNGAQAAPEAHRHVKRQGTQPRGDCVIKGNISSKKARIYHLPGQRDYASTNINPAKGEAFFCTEAEAQAAGFRVAKR